MNAPGRRPNGVYDRFPLGGFTLLYGSLLGSSPPPRNFGSRGSSGSDQPKDLLFSVSDFCRFLVHFRDLQQNRSCSILDRFQDPSLSHFVHFGVPKGSWGGQFWLFSRTFFLDRILDRFILKKAKNEKMKKCVLYRYLRYFVRVATIKKTRDEKRNSARKNIDF